MEYGVVGCGSATSTVIHEGLIDIRAKDPNAVFHIHARRAPQGSVGDVYDYLIDNEAPYIAYTRIDDKSPKILLDSAIEVVTTDDPLKSILEKVDEVLLLWDETNNESSEKIALMASDSGVSKILDLTMALAPVVIQSPKEDEETIEEPDSLKPFTREELLNMNIGVLRRQAKSVGLDIGHATKEEIVDAILGNKKEEVVEKTLVWGSKDGSLKIRIDESGVVQMITVDVKALIDSGTLKPITS